MARGDEARAKIAPGDEITVDVLRWDAGWEFDCPVVILRPAYRFFENGATHEQAAEDFALDCVLDGEVRGEPASAWWRGPSLRTLKRRFNQGMRQPRGDYRGYIARRIKVRFVDDGEGELSYELAE